jgi:hypothetical protein
VSRALFAFMATWLVGCVEERVCARLDPAPWIELSTVPAGPACEPMEAVEMHSGERDPTGHELLREYAAARGANYVVLDAFGALRTGEEIVAVNRARLFRCPVDPTSYLHSYVTPSPLTITTR